VLRRVNEGAGLEMGKWIWVEVLQKEELGGERERGGLMLGVYLIRYQYVPSGIS